MIGCCGYFSSSPLLPLNTVRHLHTQLDYLLEKGIDGFSKGSNEHPIAVHHKHWCHTYSSQ